MAKNALGLKKIPLRKMKVGDAVILGPYNHPTASSAHINREIYRNPEYVGWKLTQRQFLLIDPKTLQAYKVYLITRTA